MTEKKKILKTQKVEIELFRGQDHSKKILTERKETFFITEKSKWNY